MTDKELIQALRCCEDETCADCPAYKKSACYLEVTYGYVANRLESLLAEVERLKAQVPKWVSVEERLPETNDFVLVTFTGWIGKKEYIGGYLLAEYAHGDGWILEECPQLENPNVTHWMPLPEPSSTEGVE